MLDADHMKVFVQACKVTISHISIRDLCTFTYLQVCVYASNETALHLAQESIIWHLLDLAEPFS